MSSDTIELITSCAGFDRLVTAINKTKEGTETIRIRSEDLRALLIDHGRLLRVTPHKEPQS